MPFFLYPFYFFRLIIPLVLFFFFFFFNDTATTEIYTLSLHDALPISFWPSVSTQSIHSSAAAGCLACSVSPAPLGRRMTGARIGRKATGAPSLWAALSTVWL